GRPEDLAIGHVSPTVGDDARPAFERERQFRVRPQDLYRPGAIERLLQPREARGHLTPIHEAGAVHEILVLLGGHSSLLGKGWRGIVTNHPANVPAPHVLRLHWLGGALVALLALGWHAPVLARVLWGHEKERRVDVVVDVVQELRSLVEAILGHLGDNDTQR